MTQSALAGSTTHKESEYEFPCAGVADGSNLFDADDSIFIFPAASAADYSANILRPRAYVVWMQVEF